MNSYEKELKAIDEAKLKHADSIRSMYDKESEEDRKLNEDERLEVEEHVKAIRVLDEQESEAEANLKTIEEVEDIGRKLGPSVKSTDMRVTSEPHDRMFQTLQKSLGEQFTDSAQYKASIQAYRDAGGRFPQGFSSGAVALEAKGTLLEGAGGGGGPLAAPVPQVIGGRGGQAVPAAHVRRPAAVRAGDDQQPALRRGRHGDVWRCGRG
jgi:hypothetical protein